VANNLDVKVRLIDEFTRGLNKAEGNFKRFSKNIKTTWNTVSSLPNMIAGYAAFRMGKSFLDATLELQALEAKMTGAIPTFGAAQREMAFVAEQSDRIGLNFAKTAGEYANFAAASTRTGISLKDTRKIFTDVGEAASSLKLSGEKVSLIFMAMQQMASKSKLTMEELRQQLADHLPAAIAIAARAMNMSGGEFQKAVKNGEIYAKDFLPKFGAQIRKELGGGFETAAQQMQASINRMSNAWFKFQSGFGTVFGPDIQGGFDSITGAINGLTENMNKLKYAYELLKTPVVVVWNAFQNLTIAIAYLMDAGTQLLKMVLFPISSAFDAIGDIANTAGRQLYWFGQLAKDAMNVPSDLAGFKEQQKNIKESFAGLKNVKEDSLSAKERLKELFKYEKDLLTGSAGMWGYYAKMGDKNLEDMATQYAKVEMAASKFGVKPGKPNSDLIEPKSTVDKTDSGDDKAAKKAKREWDNYLKLRNKMAALDARWLEGKWKWEEEQQKQLLEAQSFYENARIDNMDEGRSKEIALLDLKYKEEREKYKENKRALLVIDQAYNLNRKKIEKEHLRTQIETSQMVMQTMVESFETIARENRKFVGLYKAAAIVQIIADTAVAAQAVYKSCAQSFGVAGPVIGAVAAAAVAAAGAVRVKQVANAKFAMGTRSFRTNRPQTIAVGDNPGGVEEVTVRPVSSQNVNGPQGQGSNLNLTVYDNSGNISETMRRTIRSGGADQMINELLYRAVSIGNKVALGGIFMGSRMSLA